MVTAIVSIAMFLILISLHEFGHFIVAKLLNFKVDEFSVGMGPLIFKKQKGETQYSLRLLPLGGYCKFEGEDETDNEDPRAFANQKPWKRLLVLLAGGTFNVILGFLLFLAIIVPAISPVSTNVIDEVVPHSYIEESGIQAGDKIVAINGKKVNFYNDVSLYRENIKQDEEFSLTVKRDDERLTFTGKLSEYTLTNTYTDTGIEILSSLNGFDEEEFIEYSDKVIKNDELIGTTKTRTNYIIGFRPVQEDINLLNVWGEAWNETRFVVKLVYQSFWQIITGKIGVEQMSGPVGIVSEVNTAVNSGRYSWLYVLNLIALLTINLGIFNLLPIPALDGGRILFVLWELITKKPIPPDKEGIVHAVGMLLLLLFVVFVSFHDITRLFNGG